MYALYVVSNFETECPLEQSNSRERCWYNRCSPLNPEHTHNTTEADKAHCRQQKQCHICEQRKGTRAKLKAKNIIYGLGAGERSVFFLTCEAIRRPEECNNQMKRKRIRPINAEFIGGYRDSLVPSRLVKNVWNWRSAEASWNAHKIIINRNNGLENL